MRLLRRKCLCQQASDFPTSERKHSDIKELETKTLWAMMENELERGSSCEAEIGRHLNYVIFLN